MVGEVAVSKSHSRFIDDVRRYPVDDVARRVTGRSESWCLPRPSTRPRREYRAIRTLSSGGDTPIPTGFTKDAETMALWERLPESQRAELVSLVKGFGVSWHTGKLLAKLMCGMELRQRDKERLAKHVRRHMACRAKWDAVP